MKSETIQTPFGVFSGVTRVERTPNGGIKSLRLSEKNMLVTHAGDLVPFYSEDTPRRKHKASVTFHPGSTVRAVSLEEQQDVRTPIGELPAELVTFYDTGELKRVFPLDGKITGYWTEDDERELNIPLSFAFDFTAFSAMLTGICFYKSGQIKSITLFPGETIDVTCPAVGVVPVRTGLSMFEDGTLESVEPAKSVPVDTPAGRLSAFDISAIGVNADSNSLRFDLDGRVTAVTTSDRLFVTRKSDGASLTFKTMELRTDDEELAETLPVRLTFDYAAKTVTIKAGLDDAAELSFDDDFMVFPDTAQPGCSPDACASCSLCTDKKS